MMNSFVENLIYRHLGVGERQNEGYIVQPRPRARFEQEPITPTAPENTGNTDVEWIQRAKFDTEAVSLPMQHHVAEASETEKPPLPQKQVSVESYGRPEEKQSDLIDNHYPDDINQKITALSALLRRKQSRQQEELKTTEGQFTQEPEAKPTLNITHQKSSENQPALESETNNRIKKMLQRLQGQQTSGTNNRSEIERAHLPCNVDSGSQKSGQFAATLPLPETNTNEPDSPFHVPSPDDNSPSNDNGLSQPGLLEAPDWLTAIQADITNRFQEVSAKAEPEPVVNVTIGRVEVRAVHADAPSKTRQPQKPSGVMSLEEYLIQRERRG